MERQNDRRSLLMLTTSMVIYGTIGIFRRSIPLSSGMLACVRGLLGSAFLCLFVRLRGGRIRHGMARRDLARFILSGALIGVNWILLFEAYNYTSVAVATLCYYMQPVIVILVSPFYLKEKLTAKKLLLAAAAVLVLILGIVHTGIAYALYFGSMGGLRAQTIALFSYIDPVVALIDTVGNG